jgi:hypothetical protein
MAIIYTYPVVTPTSNDLVLGTDVDAQGKPTKNFTVQSIIDLVTVTGNDLQAVLNNGNTATQNIVLTGNMSATQFTDGTITIGGGVASGFTTITSTNFAGNITGVVKNGSSIQGNVTGVTQAVGTSDTRLATTKFVMDKVDPSILTFIGTSGGNQTVNLAAQTFSILGTANQIESVGTAQKITFRFPTAGVTLPDGSVATTQALTDNSTKVATTAFVHGKNNAQDLDFIGDTGTSSVLLNSQALDFEGTTNQIVTAVTAQKVKFSLPSSVTISGTYTGATFAGDLLGTVNTATTGTTQSAGDDSTKIATTAYVDNAAGSKTLEYAGDATGPFALNLTNDDLEFNGDSNITITAAAVTGNKGIVTVDLNNDVTITGTSKAGTFTTTAGTATWTTTVLAGFTSITSTLFVGALTGNASTATALASSGAISLSGDTTSTGGPHTYTSGGAVTIPTTIANTTVTAKTLLNLPTPTSTAITASDTILAAMAKLQGQITGIPQGLVYKGTWNATTNTPTLASSTGVTGEFYIVSVAGNTNLNGITDWQVGDWAIFVEVGATDTWQKIDNSQSITGSGATNKITKWTAPTVLGTGLIEDDGTNVTIGNSGNLIVEGNTTLGNADTDSTTVKGLAIFEERIRINEGISLGVNTYGTAGQVLTSGGGSASVNTWTTPTTGTVTSVTAGTGITIGGTAADPTVAIDYLGTDNAILSAPQENGIATTDTVWFSDATDDNIKKTTVANLIALDGARSLSATLAVGNTSGANEIIMADDKAILFGTGSDSFIKHTGSAFSLINDVGNTTFTNRGDDTDIIFQSDDGSGGTATYMTIDGGSLQTKFFKQTEHQDSVIGGYGNGTDLQLFHNATDSFIDNYTGNLNFRSFATDKDIIFQSDDGSGGVTEYLRLDGSAEEIYFSKSTLLFNNVKAKFGNGSDLQIYNDGSNSFIDEGGTGDLFIRSTNGDGVYIYAGGTGSSNKRVFANSTGSVDLYYGSTKRLETTSGGINVIGEIGIGGATIIDTTATYTQIRNPESTRCIFLGDSGDPSNYYDNTSHIFRSAAGAANYLTINGSLATFEDDVEIKGNLTVDGDIIHGGGNSGTFTGSKSFTGGAASVILFRLFRPTTGALVFDVYLTSGTSGYACKKYTVAHRFNTAPNYNKIIDSGAATNGDYVLLLQIMVQSVGGDSISCSIAATTTQDIHYTVQVGQGATAVTRYTS